MDGDEEEHHNSQDDDNAIVNPPSPIAESPEAPEGLSESGGTISTSEESNLPTVLTAQVAATASSDPELIPVLDEPLASSSYAELPSDSSVVAIKTGRKRKAIEAGSNAIVDAGESDANDEEEGVICNICMEPWTNSGEHRISSLKCGHFFGYSCIEKWLKGGSGCPNCNEKATKRDLRVHYVSRLVAIDTSEKDRAVAELEKVKMEQKQLELELTTLKVTLKMQAKEIDRLRQELDTRGLPVPTTLSLQPSDSVSTSGDRPLSRLTYLKRIELIRSEPSADRDKYCRVMAFNEFYGMLIVSQPSFTALAPGYGVRKINMVDQKVGPFLALHKEPIRDLSFNPVRQDQLLSASQEKCVKLTNINTCQVMHKYVCDSEAWSCCWNLDDLNQFFVGTKRSQVLMFDTRDCSDEPKMQLEFPVMERRPIISLVYVAQQSQCQSFPSSGLLVLTLGSLWFFERLGSSESYKAHKLPIDGLFWSMRFDAKTRLLLVSTKPTPHSRHMMCELTRVNVSDDPLHPDFRCSCNIIYDQKRGGSYSERSFLRSTLFTHPNNEQQMLIAYGRGSGNSDHKVMLQEIGTENFQQDMITQKPVLDICPLTINGEQFLAILCETDFILYKWTK